MWKNEDPSQKKYWLIYFLFWFTVIKKNFFSSTEKIFFFTYNYLSFLFSG